MTNATRTDAAFGLIPIWHSLKDSTDRRYLLILHQKGHWAFPKGHADPGETPLETALREVREETGLQDFQVMADRPFEEYYEFVSPDGHPIAKTVTYFVGMVPRTEEPPAVTVQWAEVSDFAWCTYPEAMERITFAANRQVLQACELFLQELGKNS